MPPHVLAEALRLRHKALAATNAKEAYVLSDKDLQELEHTKKDRGALGSVKLYRLDAGARCGAGRGAAGPPPWWVLHRTHPEVGAAHPCAPLAPYPRLQ